VRAGALAELPTDTVETARGSFRCRAVEDRIYVEAGSGIEQGDVVVVGGARRAATSVTHWLNHSVVRLGPA
jgi:hypothetical protein